MSLQVYQLVHLISVMLLVGTTFAAFANPDPDKRKSTLMGSGILSFLVLLGGFGLKAKVPYDIGWPGWLIVKLGCWLVLSGLAGIAFRKPGSAGGLRVIAILVIAAAVSMVYLRPF